MKVSACTDQGLKRHENEDTFAISKDRRYYIVADGMGGHRAGEVASKLAVQTLSKFLEENLSEHLSLEDIAKLLDRGLRLANEAIFQTAKKNRGYRGMGTTLTAALFYGGYLFIAHIGDSRAYLLRRWEMKQITQDHSLVQELVRNGGITRDEAATHPHKHILTQALGTERQIAPQVTAIPVFSGDYVLLCTDGLTGHLRDEEIKEIILSSGNVDEAVQKMQHLALQRGGDDNITIILVGVE